MKAIAYHTSHSCHYFVYKNNRCGSALDVIFLGTMTHISLIVEKPSCDPSNSVAIHAFGVTYLYIKCVDCVLTQPLSDPLCGMQLI